MILDFLINILYFFKDSFLFFLFNLILSFIFFNQNIEFIKNNYSDYSNIYLKDLKSKKFIPNSLFEVNIKRFSYNQINYFEKLNKPIFIISNYAFCEDGYAFPIEWLKDLSNFKILNSNILLSEIDIDLFNEIKDLYKSLLFFNVNFDLNIKSKYEVLINIFDKLILAYPWQKIDHNLLNNILKIEDFLNKNIENIFLKNFKNFYYDIRLISSKKIIIKKLNGGI
jgi:hypothetical protein